MAGIGLYGVFYSPCVKSAGVTTGYSGDIKMMGKAISANFEPNVPDEDSLAANNGVAETNASSGSGGTLTQTLDRMTLETASALYGTTVQKVTVTVGETQVEGTEISYKGSEVSVPVGAAYIKMAQEDGVRIHELVFYREVLYSRPSDDAQTLDPNGSIEWKTPELTGQVAGMQGDGSNPWYRISRWPTQEAALAYMETLFGGTLTDETKAAVQALNEEETA